MRSTPHRSPTHPEKKQETPRSTKLTNGAILGVAAAVVLGTAAAVVQGQQAQARNAEAAAAYAPSLTATELTTADRVVIIGDSYTAGSDMGGFEDENWTRKIQPMVSKEGHPTEYKVVGLGGSGYLATGSADKTFLDGAKEAVTPGTDIVVVFGSRNDPGENDGTTLPEAAQEFYQYVEDTAPGAQLIVIGVQAPYDEPRDTDAAIADDIRTAAEGHADVFLDPIAEDWFDDEAIIGEDKVHPTDEGHTHMAELIAPTLRDALEAPREDEGDS